MYGWLIGTHQRSFEWYHPPMASPSSRLGVCNLATPSYLRSQEQVKLRTSNLAGTNPNKSPLKLLEKGDRGRIQGLPKFLGYPLLSQERVKLKLRTSNFVTTLTGSIGTKAHVKCWE